MAGRITPAAGRYGGRTAAERQAERRGRLLEAGLELFGAGPGYRATKVADVSRLAGLSTRQFYEEFHSLEDLLAELHLQGSDLAERSVAAVLADLEGAGPVERCTTLFLAYAAGATGDPRHARIAFVESIGVSERLDRQRLERRARWASFLCDQMNAAVARGEIAPRDFRITAAAFIGSVHGLLHDWAVGWVDATLEQVLDELLLMLMATLRAESDPVAGVSLREV